MNAKPEQTANKASWTSKIRTSSGGITAFAYLTMLALVGGFGTWAFLAPLSGAVIAPGTVIASGQNVAVQHLEGGIIKEILVKEGSRVKRSEPLVLFDDAQVSVTLGRLTGQATGLQARLFRLQAERDGADQITVPEDFTPLDEPAFQQALAEQKAEFQTRLERYNTELSILDQRGKALDANAVGLQARKAAIDEQKQVVSEEVDRKKDLLDRGLTNRSEYTALVRALADLTGQAGALESQIASTRIQKAEAREQVERMTTQRVENALTELTEIRLKLDDTLEQIKAARDIIRRTTVRSPVDGIVVQSQINTSGAVVEGGKALMVILPTSEDLLIEARITPRDIDNIHVGQSARLRFSGLNTRITPDVAGRVIYVSADRLVSEDGKDAYFAARLKIDADKTDNFDFAEVYPGMPVESFIATDERTFAEYLVKPLTDSLTRAFREE